MAVFYVRSTTGSDANNGSTWALAKATIAGALAIAASGDTIWVSQVHAESITGSITWSAPGTLTAPVQILCGNDTSQPPTALATTATSTNTTGFDCSMTACYVYGLTIFMAGSTSSVLAIADQGTCRQVWDTCSFQFTTTAGSAIMRIGGNTSFNPTECLLLSPTFKLASSSQVITLGCKTRIRGGSWLSGGTNPTVCFGARSSNRAMDAIVTAFDFSSLSTSQIFIDGSTNGTETGSFVMRYCKLPASWSGSLVNGTPPGPGFHAEMKGCAAGAQVYQYWRETGFGTIKNENTNVMTSAGGASDGTTGISHKFVTPNSSNLYPATFLEDEEYMVWNDVTGSARTLTIELLHDSLTGLKDNDIWVDVVYLGDASTPLGSVVSSETASVVATPATLASSSATWNTSGLTNPNAQKMSVSFTAQQKGPVIARVAQALKNKTVFVNPNPILS